MRFDEFKEKKQQFDNSKLGSVIKLSVWIVLLIIFASVVRTGGSTVSNDRIDDVISKPTILSVKSKFNINSYEASVIVNSDIVSNIRLTNYGDKFLLFYNGEKYYKSDVLYLLSTREIVDNRLLSDVVYYDVKNIFSYLENVDEDYFTVYRDDSFSMGYTIPVNDGNMSFEINESSSKVNVVISGNNNIDKVEVYFDDFYINSIVYNLSNVNNIEDIEVD